MLDIKRFVVNPFQENCYVVSDATGEAVVIDCGAYYPEERNALTDYIRQKKLTPRHLLATHAHIDHNFGNDTMLAAFGLKPEVCGADAQLMATLAEQAEALCGIRLGYDLSAPSLLLADGDTISFGQHELQVVATPGHSPGSVFFTCAEEGVAFSGDTLFCGSIGRTDFWQGSYGDIMSSLARVKGLLPADTTILPGHGPQTTMARELSSNPYMR